jgi:Domain of unknown function (DUF4350)
MSTEPVFSRRLLIGWIAGAIVVFALSLYLMGAGEMSGIDNTGPGTFSRSAIGHAGIADVLQRLGIPVVKSQHNSLEKLSPGSVLVIAEPRPTRQSEEAIRTLLKAGTILLVLPKWTGQPSEQTAGWLRQAGERFLGDAQWTLNLVAPRAEVVRGEAGATGSTSSWSTNEFGLTPNPVPPMQLMRGGGLRPIIANDRGMLLGETGDRNRKVWVLSDPDLISNHGLAREQNAALAVALLKRLRAADGSIVFDETVHGYLARPESPFMLMFRFPFVVATIQGLIAILLLLWATLERFGAPQTAPPPLRAGREGLLQNIAKLIEYSGHQQVVIRRYISETIRDAARQLHAPSGLSGEALTAWLQRVGAARGVGVDCGALVRQLGELDEARGREPSSLVRLARDIHKWKGQILDGRSRYSRHR